MKPLISEAAEMLVCMRSSFSGLTLRCRRLGSSVSVELDNYGSILCCRDSDDGTNPLRKAGKLYLLGMGGALRLEKGRKLKQEENHGLERRSLHKPIY